MRKYLVFHLYGPLASFGETAVGEYRPSSSHPSKSAIMGLVAASLGIRRTEEDRLKELSENLGFGVLVLSMGSLLRDYHTTQVPSSVSVKRRPVYTRKDELSHSDLNTILSTRDYRMDAVYRIALWSKGDSVDLLSIKEALQKPKFSLYLGRKSCPLSIPINPVIVNADFAKNALVQNKNKLDDLLVKVIESNKTKNENSYLLYQDIEIGMKEVIAKKWRKDKLINRKAWQYGNREEVMLNVEGKDVFK